VQTFQVEVDSAYHKKIAFSPDGRYLALDVRTLTLLDTTGGPARSFPELGILCYGMAFVRNGAAIACTPYAGGIQVLDLATGTARKHMLKKVYPHAVAAVPSADAFYVSIFNFGGKSDLRLFGTANLKRWTSFAQMDERVDRLALSADGRWLAGHSSWVTLRVWNVSRSKLPVHTSITVETRVSPNDFALSADGSRLVAGDSYALYVWDTATGARVVHSGKHRRGVMAVACNPTKPIIATGDNVGNVFLWDHAGNILTRFDWGLGHVSGLTFAADGLRCAAIGGTGKVVIWDVDA
jgi:WD40 repeat protein